MFFFLSVVFEVMILTRFYLLGSASRREGFGRGRGRRGC